MTCLARAALNGLFLPSPSAAVDPAFDANAISVLRFVGSTFASPRPTARDAIVRFIVRENGLSRQASRMTNLNCLAGSTATRIRSSESASS